MLEVTVDVNGGRALLVVDGEVEQHTAARLTEGVSGALADGADHLRFDLGGVTFMDSSGLRAIVMATERTEVEVANPTKNVRRMFEISGLDHLLR